MTRGTPFAWHIAVLIPARNEEDLLPSCLVSVMRAKDALPEYVSCEIVVAVDSSSDATLQIARHLLKDDGIVVETTAGIVGAARALAAKTSMDRYRGSLARCWLAQTDADCIVPECWLAQHLSLADSGFEAVAGIVDVTSFEEHLPDVKSRFRASYALHPDGTHPHIHGANLGIRADVYLKAGGWKDLATAEDHDLWRRVVKGGAKAISSSELIVMTSGRRTGRAPCGFAAALAAHNESAA